MSKLIDAEALKKEISKEPVWVALSVIELIDKMPDESQTDCDGCQHYADEYTADTCYECKRSYTDCYVPRAERIE